MRDRRLTTLGVGGTSLLLTLSALAAGPADQFGSARTVDAERSIQDFVDARPGSRLAWQEGRISRVYGKAFAQGPTAFHSAKSFVDTHSEMFGVPARDLAPIGKWHGGEHMQPLMYDKDTGTYKFTACGYTQVRDGIEVFNGKLVVLCRNEADHPVVLASANLRDLGEFTVDPAKAVADLAQLDAIAKAEFGPDAIVNDARPVIYAGVDGEDHEATQAFDLDIRIGIDEWRLITHATTGDVLLREHRVYFGTVTGNVGGNATDGPATAECDPEVVQPLPYLEVTNGVDTVFTDVNGDFSIPAGGGGLANISASLVGEWFFVDDFFDLELTENTSVTPPGPANLLFNSSNLVEEDIAQVNAYVESNKVRDFVVAFNPAYPTLNDGNFPVNVNRTDGFCPANAWYSPGDVTINFCQSTGSAPNTAWSSVVHHEFGHHLVEAAGSGQGQYGEGMGDVMSVLLLDDNRLGVGWGLDCNNWLRDADNTEQYPCSGGIHACGQLISGCVWDTRNELQITEPANYIEILGNLAVNSILVHTGSSITPQITIDYLTLDDDNTDILDGTPHYNEIDAGFGAHNMPAPELALVGFQFPEGRPDTIGTGGGDPFEVQIVGVTQSPVSGSAMLMVSSTGVPGSYSPLAMNETSANVYDAQLPAGNCGDPLYYYFTVNINPIGVATSPAGAEDDVYQTVYATQIVEEFGDDFEADTGWSVLDDGLLTDGTWDRGVPVGGGDRGDPPTDADGSGQCYLTDNVDGNSDVDAGSTTLTSPILDATTGDGTPYISYWRWYSNDQGSSAFDDILVIEVSDDAGANWTELEVVGPTGSEVSGGWFYRQFRIEDFVSVTNQFQIRFIASDTDPQSIVEAAVDGISIDSFECAEAPCPGDTDGNGEVNVDDLNNVIVDWGTDGSANGGDVAGPGGGPADGIVGVDDLNAVIVNWGLCP